MVRNEQQGELVIRGPLRTLIILTAKGDGDGVIERQQHRRVRVEDDSQLVGVATHRVVVDHRRQEFRDAKGDGLLGTWLEDELRIHAIGRAPLVRCN